MSRGISLGLSTATCPIRTLKLWPRRQYQRESIFVFNRNQSERPRREYAGFHSTASSSDSSTNHGSSVSASEVTHFSALASSWWDPHGPSRLLHLMNPLRHDFIRACLETTSSTSAASSTKQFSFLDVGCGGGIFASSAARLPNTTSVTAIDPTPEVIAVAKQHQRCDPLLSQHGKLTYLNCAIEELDNHSGVKPKEGFDIVTLFEVIEHVDKPAAFLRQALSHLRIGGWLVGSTIARHPVSYLTTKIIAEAPWPVGVVPPGTHDWDKYINPLELRQWFAKENREARTIDRASAEETGDKYGPVQIEGCVYVPILGWKFVNGSEQFGNYFFGIQRLR